MREQLKKARREAGMTQEKMAAELGIGARYYKGIESGEKLGAIWIWDKLEDMTGIPQHILRENHLDKVANPRERPKYPQS